MARKAVRIAMNGVTGRMGYRQHLVRSLLSIRDQGGVLLDDGTAIFPEPVLVGRDEQKLRQIAERHGIGRWTTSLDDVLSDPGIDIYFDAQVTTAREPSLRKVIAAGKHVYTEKPVADSLDGAVRRARAAREAGLVHGVVQDKLFLPGVIKLRRLIKDGFFGRVLSVRLEFGYWVFEGDGLASQRPSWNYRKDQGGGIILDMFPHWQYLLEDLFGPIHALYARHATHVPVRWDERGAQYDVTADDAAYALLEFAGGAVASVNSSWAVRVNRRELVELHVGGLQDRHRVPRLAERAAAPLRDARGLPAPAAGRPSGPGIRAGRRRGRAAVSRPGGRADDQLPGSAAAAVIGLSRLSMNQATVSKLNLTQTLRLCVEQEIPAVGLWRHRVAELGIRESAAAVRRSGLHVSSLCRGGFFTHAESGARRAAVADNLVAVQEAAALE